MAEYSDPDSRSSPGASKPDLRSASPGYGTVSCGTFGAGMETGHTQAASEPDAIGQIREQGKTLVSEAKQQSAALADQAKQQVNTLLTGQKARAAERLVSVAGVLRETANKLGTDELGGRVGRYANQAAAQVESMSNYVRGTDFQTFLHDTGQFARRRPEVFLAGTFLAGLLAARFLKASIEHRYQPAMPAGGR